MLDIKKYVVENYLPVLNAWDVITNRHRECHRLPDTLRNLEAAVKLHVEVHSFEIKLFEGSDFDFLPSNSINNGAKLIQDYARNTLR